MSKQKDQSKPAAKESDIKTPTPPQDMDPSKTPHPGKKVLGDEQRKSKNDKKKA